MKRLADWLRRRSSAVGRDRRWISDARERDAHDDVVRERLPPLETPVVFDGGPRHGESGALDHLPVVIGTGSEGGVYQRTGDGDDGLVVYRWQPLSDAASDALVRGDLRANQEPDE